MSDIQRRFEQDLKQGCAKHGPGAICTDCQGVHLDAWGFPVRRGALGKTRLKPCTKCRKLIEPAEFRIGPLGERCIHCEAT